MDRLLMGTRGAAMALIFALNAVACRDVSAPGTSKRAFVYVGADFVRYEQVLGFRAADASLVNEIGLGQGIGNVKKVECSPDGSQAAFLGSGPNFWGYFLVNSDGTGRRELIIPGASIGPGGWSPKGDRLAVRYAKPGAEGIAIINTDGTVLATFPMGPVANGFLYLSWSPDGTEILYTAQDPSLRVMALSVATGATRQILAAGHQARWSPDGQRIAYLGPFSNLFVANRDGTSANLLVQAGGNTLPNSFTWTPDGRILFETAGKLYFVTLGGTVTPFIPEGIQQWVHWCGTP